EDGVIQQDETGAWKLVRDLDSFAIPASVSALITARLDRLNPAEQFVVQRAAVVGQQFFRDAIEYMLPEHARPSVDRALERLAGHGLVTQYATSFALLGNDRVTHTRH